MNTEIIDYNVTDASITEMEQAYMPLVVTGTDDKDGFKIVTEARKEVKDLRVSVEKTRKSLNADALSWQREVNSEAKRITGLLTPIENHLKTQERIVLDEQERVKVEKQRLIDVRHMEMKKDVLYHGVTFNGRDYTWGENTFSQNDLWNMTDIEFRILIAKIRVWDEERREAQALIDAQAKKDADELAVFRAKQAELAKAVNEEPKWVIPAGSLTEKDKEIFKNHRADIEPYTAVDLAQEEIKNLKEDQEDVTDNDLDITGIELLVHTLKNIALPDLKTDAGKDAVDFVKLGLEGLISVLDDRIERLKDV